MVEHDADNFKRLFMPTVELLQAHLKCLNKSKADDEHPILQYTILLDLSDVSMQNIVCGYLFDRRIIHQTALGCQPVNVGD